MDSENNGKNLTADTHYDIIVRTTMMSHISVENVRNMPDGTHFACIILTYSKSNKIYGPTVILPPLEFRKIEFLPGHETHWLFSVICNSPDG